MEKFRVLSFDGGGVRGILSIDILCRLINDESNKEVIEMTDLFAGTSVGSFLALGLASGMTAQDLAETINDEAPEIFGDPKFGGPVMTTKYSNKTLIKVVKSILPGSLRMGDLKKKVVIPTFKLTDTETKQWSPVLMHNFANSPYLDLLVVDAALRSSAAPVFLPEHDGYIDGGVTINNPSTAAITTTIEHNASSLSDIVMLSIGAGYFPYGITRNTSSWGAISSQNRPVLTAPSWAIIPQPISINEPPFPIFSIVTDGSVAVNDAFSSSLLGENYCRINPILPKPVNVDDTEAMPILRQLAKEIDLTEASAFLSDAYQ